jgi:FAD dependent oxidoreductase
MVNRSSVPVGLPVETPTESFWQCPPDEIAKLRSSELPAEADVVIVGSGITGAAVAWGLLNDNDKERILMLEARDACSGATGRNGELPTHPQPKTSLQFAIYGLILIHY